MICPEQDCDTLVYYFDQAKSMLEMLNLHETFTCKERVEKFHEWYDKVYNKDKWTWETTDRKELVQRKLELFSKPASQRSWRCEYRRVILASNR